MQFYSVSLIEMKVIDKSVVVLRYRMTNSRGIELENIIAGPSISYIHGSGNINPLLESELRGLCAGDRKTIFISNDKGFENIDDDFTVEVVIDEVRPATENELMNGLTGSQNPDENCGPDCIC